MSNLSDVSPQRSAGVRIASIMGKFLFCMLLAFLVWLIQTDGQKAYADESQPAYALLYSDGTLVFQRGTVPDSSKSLASGTNTFPVDENTVYQSTDDIPWYVIRDQVKRVTFKDTISPKSTSFWFSGMTKCRSIDLAKLNTGKLAGILDETFWTYTFDVSHMFEGCSSLASLDLSAFENPKGGEQRSFGDLRSMLEGCSSLVSLHISSSMNNNWCLAQDAFTGCISLSFIDSGALFCWDKDNVADGMAIDLPAITGKTWYSLNGDGTIGTPYTASFPAQTSTYTTNSPLSLAEYNVDIAKSYAFSGNFITPHADVSKTEDSGILTEGFDYTLAFYSDEACTKETAVGLAGTYYVQATGIGAYAGTTQAASFTVEKNDANLKPIDNLNLLTSADPSKVTISYDGEGDVAVMSSDPSIAEASYDPTTKQITVMPKSAGAITVTVSVAEDANHNASETSFEVTVIADAVSLADYEISASDLTFNGSAQKPTVSVRANAEASPLVEGSDYTLAYYSDAACTTPVEADKLTDVGTYYVKAAGIGNYVNETKAAEFRIANKTAAALSFADDAQEKLAGLKVGDGPITVGLTYAGRETLAATDISVTCENGNVSASYDSAKGELAVSPLKAGADTITITVAGDDAYGQATTTLAVTVAAGKSDPDLDADAEYTLTVGGTSQTISYDGELSYTLDKEGIVEVVSSNGGKTLTVKPIAKGVATLTVSADETDQYKALGPLAIKFTVKEAESPEKQVIPLTPLSLTAGSTVSGGVTLKDADGNSINGTVNVTSTKESVAQATYDSSTHKFTIKALAVGTATIKFASDDAASDYTLDVTVTKAPQKAEVKLVDAGKTGVMIGVDKIDLPNATSDEDVEMVVEALTSGDAYNALVAKKGDGEFVGVYAITLNVNGQGVHSDFGSVTLTFPVDASYNGQQVTVWHLHEDGSVTSETATVADGKVSIAVTDLSTFAVEVAKADTTGDAGATTGDTAQTSGGSGLTQTGDAVPPAMAGAAVAAVAGLIACLVSRRRGKRVGLSAEAPHDLVS